MTRYTVDGSAALEEHIGQAMAEIGERVEAVVGRQFLEALVLGGGYGRGEGAVVVRDEGERPYNDYDFFVIVTKAAASRHRAIQRSLLELHHDLTSVHGIDVDFSRPVSVERLPSLPYTLMWMELAAGGIVVRGRQNVLNDLPCWDPSAPPLTEGARLLLNRSAGLVLARQRVRQGAPYSREDLEFIVRNGRKADMAAGDVVLMVRQTYSPSYVERRRRLAQLPPSEFPTSDLQEAHRDAIAFKLRPTHDAVPADALAFWLDQVATRLATVFLWFEGLRLGTTGLDNDSYRELPTRLGNPGFAAACVNVARHVKGRGVTALATPTSCLTHPRDRLLAQVPALLTGATSTQDEAAFLKLWRRFD